MKRLLALARTVAVLALVAVHVHGVVLLAQSWNARRDMSCDWPGVPYEAMDGCRFGVAMADWGQQ